MVTALKQDLENCINPDKAAFFPRFFKTGKGQYGEGDIFWGITVPNIRGVVKKYQQLLSLDELQILIVDPIHEVRLAALLVLVHQFTKSKDPALNHKIYEFYLANTKWVNNWDLVDSSAAHIVGAYLYDKNREKLYELVNSQSLWEQRIAIIATFYFIRKNEFKDTLTLAEKLLHHPHDLIHKAVGWMLREVGNRNVATLEEFLNSYYNIMPRTMLRYAIEKFPDNIRKAYLQKL
jgi:3-methyladenine DNA glycosylase AlkD